MAGVFAEQAGAADAADAGVVQNSGRERGAAANRNLSDDEILGLGVRSRSRKGAVRDEQPNVASIAAEESVHGTGDHDNDLPLGNGDAATDGEEYHDVFEAKPELKRAWDEARAYREAFATPEEACAATKMVADLRAMDALFFSKRGEDKTELARLVAELDSEKFDALAKAMGALAAERQSSRASRDVVTEKESPRAEVKHNDEEASTHRGFLQAANADAVRGVLQAIEAQVARVLPESVPKGARNRVVGEIYRELDQSLQANPDFVKHVRSAVRTGNCNVAHQNAVAALVIGRAKQSLPSVAKRVLGEWTSTIVAANHDRREKQRSAESRIDIAGARGGKDASRARSPRDIDYSRMSDADILNL